MIVTVPLAAMATVPPPGSVAGLTLAAAMLPLALAMWREGAAVDAALALPLYLRDKVAQTTLEREAARVAKEEAAGVAR